MQMDFKALLIIMKFMKYFIRYRAKEFIVALIILCSMTLRGLPFKGDSLRFEVLLSSKMVRNIQPYPYFINSIEIGSNEIILLSSKDQFYLLGFGIIKPVCNKVPDKISSYAYTSDNLLMVIRNDEICTFDSIENLSKLIQLPRKGMGISAGKHVMYIYDRSNEQSKHSLFVLAQGGKYKKLFEAPAPIQSVVEMNNSILFATKHALFHYNPKNSEVKTLAALSKGKEINSITVDTISNRIYFSTNKAVYAIKDSSTILITDRLGGVLRFFNDGLIIFNPEKRLLIRLVGIEHEVASLKLSIKPVANNTQTTDMLTNATIIDMVYTKLSDDLIINLINRSEVNFNVSVDAMIFLAEHNVSSVVIMAMRKAMKNKSVNVPNGSNQ